MKKVYVILNNHLTIVKVVSSKKKAERYIEEEDEWNKERINKAKEKAHYLVSPIEIEIRAKELIEEQSLYYEIHVVE